MNDKLEQVNQALAEIAKLSLEEQPEAFSQLHQQLDQELNSTESKSEAQE